MSISGGPDIIENGLVLYLDAADNSSYINGSSTWYDISTSGLSGTLTNGPTYNSGNKGSIVFDGTNDYISISHNSILNLLPITICGWINVDNTNTGGEIFNKYYSSSVNGYRFYAAYGSGLQLYYFYGGSVSNGLASYDSYSGTFTRSGWNHVCCTIDSTGAILYLNTVSVGTRSWAGSPSTTTTTQNITIGNYPPTSTYFNGQISNISVYNRALSANEILQNFNSTKGRYNL